MFLATINTTSVFNLKDVSREKLRAVVIGENTVIDNIEVFIGTKSKKETQNGKYVINIIGSGLSTEDPADIYDHIFSWFKQFARLDIIPINFSFSFSILNRSFNIFNCENSCVIFEDGKNGEIEMNVIELFDNVVDDSYKVICEIRL